MTVADRLKEHCDAQYQAFQSKLVPNIPADTILGVRTPDMRRIAKEVNGTEEAGAAELACVVKKNTSVLVEADV